MFVICVVCSGVLVFDLPGWWCGAWVMRWLVVYLHIRWLWDTLLLLSFFSRDLLVVGGWLVVTVCLV